MSGEVNKSGLAEHTRNEKKKKTKQNKTKKTFHHLDQWFYTWCTDNPKNIGGTRKNFFRLLLLIKYFTAYF